MAKNEGEGKVNLQKWVFSSRLQQITELAGLIDRDRLFGEAGCINKVLENVKNNVYKKTKAL